MKSFLINGKRKWWSEQWAPDALDLVSLTGPLARQKRDARHLATTSLLFFAAVEWGQNWQRDDLPEPPLAIRNLGTLVGGCAHADYEARWETYFAQSPVLACAPEEAAALEPSKNLGQILSELPEGSHAADLLWAILEFAAKQTETGLVARFVPLGGLGLVDYQAALLRRAPYQPETDLKALPKPGHNVWLCQYRRDNGQTFEDQIQPGNLIAWSPRPMSLDTVMADIGKSDVVAIWRTVDKAGIGDQERSRGGIVGWAEIVGRLEGGVDEGRGSARAPDAAEEPAPDHSQSQSGRIEMRVLHGFTDDPIERDRILSLLTKRSPAWPNPISFTKLDLDDAAVFARLQSVAESGVSNIDRVASDKPEESIDLLGRAPLAFAMATLLNRLYDETEQSQKGEPADAAFVLHLDSPWGGGKTTFANYVVRLLNPRSFGIDLTRSYPNSSIFGKLKSSLSQWDMKWCQREWVSISFNAWQHQHIEPPWWDFYETVRKATLKGMPWHRKAWHHVLEFLWRFFTPQLQQEILILIGILFVIVTFYSIFYYHGINFDISPGKSGGEFVLLVSAFGVTVTSIIAGISAFRRNLRSVVAAVSQSADETHLGSADPLNRFRRHLQAHLDRLGKPMVIVIDDLDRCDQKYVFELTRGLITIFHSPQVFFILLGDKSWIEGAFVEAHPAMAKIDKDPDRSFGARFAEKLIQLSFILPALDESDRRDYVNRLLVEKREEGRQGSKPNAEFDAILREARTMSRRRSTQDVRAHSANLRWRIEQADFTDDKTAKALQREIDTQVMLSTVGKSEEDEEIRHHLLDFLEYLPDNPRRIKRLINMVAIYQASAQITCGVQPGSDRWKQLVRWVTLMSEFPVLWEILARDAEQVDLLEKLCRQPALKLSPDENPIAEYSERSECTNLLFARNGSGADDVGGAIDTAAVRWLATITPV